MRISEKKGREIIFNISSLKEYLHNISIIFELFKSFGLTNAMVPELIKVISGKTGSYILTGTHRIIKNRNELIVTGEVRAQEAYYISKSLTDLRKVPGIVSARYISDPGKNDIPGDPSGACIDTEKLRFPLIIRNWREGDYFYPFGMSHKKKLSDYFTDRKYSKIEKENILILESDGEIVWIIGDRIDNRFRLTESTKKALVIKAEGAKAQGRTTTFSSHESPCR